MLFNFVLQDKQLRFSPDITYHVDSLFFLCVSKAMHAEGPLP